MKFENRLKGNITETIVKALLVDEGYRVIDSGIEHIIREVSCLDSGDYNKLLFADTLRKLPDLVVLNKEQTVAHLVEVKYRQSWNSELIQSLKEQVLFFNKLILVCVNGSPVTESAKISGGTHLRAIELKFEGEKYLARKYITGSVVSFDWVDVDKDSALGWWDLAPIQFVFQEMTSNKYNSASEKHGESVNILLACRAIESLMNKDIWDVSNNNSPH